MATGHTNTTSPALQEATKISTTVWRQDLEALFHHAKDRFPDVVWEVGGGDEDDTLYTEEVWGHKAIVYARAPPSFQTRYFSFRPSSPTGTLPTTSALSLDIARSISRTPSPFRSSSPAQSSAPNPPSSLLRLSTSINPALFSNELEYLYTGQGFGEAFEFLFDSSETNHSDTDAEELRIDKLRKDLVFMWRSRLYSDVRIALTGNFSSSSHENTTAIFSSHRFILVSRSPYFHTALIAWPTKPSQSEPQTLNLPSPPFTPASLHFTLGFLYTGTLIFSHRSYDLSTAFHILRSALYLSLPTLHDEIQARIIQEMMHGLFHAFLPFEEYERLTAGAWGTGGCRCRQCARRAPRVLEFALADDVKNQLLERGARRALVGLFGEGWCTPEFAGLPVRLRESLLKGVGKRTTPANALALLCAAEHALGRLAAVIDAWAGEVREMVLVGRRTVDELVCEKSEECFSERDWNEIMERDGIAFEDGERVEWIMTSVLRGVNERNAPMLYQTLVSSILLRPHPTESDAPMLSSTSHIRVQVEQTRIDLLKWIGKRWIGIRQEGGFDELEGWALKEISDNLEVPLEDLITPAPRSTLKPHHPQPRASTLLRAKETESNADSISMHSSMRVSVLSRNLPATSPTTQVRRISPSSRATSSGGSFKSLPRTNGSRSIPSSPAGRASDASGHSEDYQNDEEELDDEGKEEAEKNGYGYGYGDDTRPDSKLTPGLSSIGLPPYSSRSTSPTPQPSIIEPREDDSNAPNPYNDAQDEDIDERSARSSPAPSAHSTSPSIKSAVMRTTGSKAIIRKVTPTSTVARRAAAGMRPTSSASSIHSTVSVSSVRSHASTIRKSTTTESSKGPGGLRPPPQHTQKPTTAVSRTKGTRTASGGTSPSLSLRTTPTRPTSSVSNTSDGSTTFRTANSTIASIPAPRSRRGSAASNVSNVSARGPPSTTGGGGGGRQTPTRPGRPSPAAAGVARVRKTSAGSTKSTFSVGGSGSTPTRRPPLPTLDTNKVSPVGGSAKKPASLAPSVRSATSTVSTAASAAARKAANGSAKKAEASVGKAGYGVNEKKVPVSSVRQTAADNEDSGTASISSEGASLVAELPLALPPTSSAITVKGKSKVPPVIADHKKSGSTASTGSSSTLKRKGSSDTITTRVSGTTSSNRTKSSISNINDNDQNKKLLPVQLVKELPKLPFINAPRGAMLEIGIPCIIASKRKRFKAYARYIGEVEGEEGPWVGVEVPVGESWSGSGNDREDGERQWHDGTWGGIRYFEIGNGGGSEWEYSGGVGDDRAARRRRLDWVGGGSGSTFGGGKGMLKREGDQLSVDRVKRFRSVSPAVSEMESRGLFVRPQQVLYVVDAVGSDL